MYNDVPDGNASTSAAAAARRTAAHAARRALGMLDRLGQTFVQRVVAINAAVQRSTSLQLAVVLGFVGGSLALSWLLMPKVEYLPNGNRNLVFGQLLPPAGYNIDRLTELGRELEKETQPYWDVDRDDPNNRRLPFPPIDDYFFVASGQGSSSAPGRSIRCGQATWFRWSTSWATRFRARSPSRPRPACSAGGFRAVGRSTWRSPVPIRRNW